MRPLRLQDEIATRQEQQIDALGGELYTSEDLLDEGIDIFADPAEILAALEEQQIALLLYLKGHTR